MTFHGAIKPLNRVYECLLPSIDLPVDVYYTFTEAFPSSPDPYQPVENPNIEIQDISLTKDGDVYSLLPLIPESMQEIIREWIVEYHRYEAEEHLSALRERGF